MLAQLTGDIGSALTKYGSAYLSGMLYTVLLATIATLFGCIIGFICGILQTIPVQPNDRKIKKILLTALRAVIRIYIEIFRGTPMILQAVFIYYGVPYFTKGAVNFSNIWTVSILVVSINTGAYMAESVRGGILSVDSGQTEGAKSIGMTHFQTMFHVVLPQALRNIMPQIGNNFIINIKDTSVMFIIGFAEFFSVHKMVAGATFKYFPSAMIEMIGYLTMTVLASFLLRKLENRLDGKENYELVSADQMSAVGNYINRTRKEQHHD